MSLFKMAPKHSAAMLFTVPKYRKAVMCLTEKAHEVGKLCVGMSYTMTVLL